MKKIFTMWLPDEERQALRRIAFEKDKSMAEIFRESLKCFIENERKKTLAPKTEESAAE